MVEKQKRKSKAKRPSFSGSIWRFAFIMWLAAGILALLYMLLLVFFTSQKETITSKLERLTL